MLIYVISGESLTAVTIVILIATPYHIMLLTLLFMQYEVIEWPWGLGMRPGYSECAYAYSSINQNYWHLSGDNLAT